MKPALHVLGLLALLGLGGSPSPYRFAVNPRVCFSPCTISVRYRVTPDTTPSVTLYAISEAGEEIISTQPTRDFTVTRQFTLSPGTYEVGLAWGGKYQVTPASVQVISLRH